MCIYPTGLNIEIATTYTTPKDLHENDNKNYNIAPLLYQALHRLTNCIEFIDPYKT